MSERLSLAALERLPDGVRRPGYDPAAQGAGIVHIGVGAFHRAHQAVYTDAALAGRRWGLAYRRRQPAQHRHRRRAQPAGRALHSDRARRGRGDAHRRGDPARHRRGAGAGGGGGRAGRSGDQDRHHDGHGKGLRNRSRRPGRRPVASGGGGRSRQPARARRRAGLDLRGVAAEARTQLAAFTVLCCDNLPDNGGLLAAGVVGFARRLDAELADWIEGQVAFPSTMVDRITPAPTAATLADAERLTGFGDLAAVETEPFSQWVVEDRFPAGRPAWEACGALFVDDVAPYEEMKLRMLNGTHSLMAYVGLPVRLQICARRDAGRRTRHARGSASRRGRSHARSRWRRSTCRPTPKRCWCASATPRSPTRRSRSPWTVPRSCRSASSRLLCKRWKRARICVRSPSPRRPGCGSASASPTRPRHIGSTIHAPTGSRPRSTVPTMPARSSPRCRRCRGFVPPQLSAAPRWTDAVREILAAMLDHGVKAAVAEEAARPSAR